MKSKTHILIYLVFVLAGLITIVGVSFAFTGPGSGTPPSPTPTDTIAGSRVSGNISGNSSNVTGIVSVSHGGTGATSLTGVLIGNGTSTVTGFVGSASGDVLTWNGSAWVSAAPSGGTGLPPGTSGQTIRHNGTDWAANSILFNNGTNIGIGTTSPSYRLEVDNAGGTSVVLIQDSTNSDGIRYEESGLYSHYVNDNLSIGATQDLRFLTYDEGTTSWNERARLLDNGQLGIGTTTPGYKLRVNAGYSEGVRFDSDISFPGDWYFEHKGAVGTWVTESSISLNSSVVNLKSVDMTGVAVVEGTGGPNIGIGTTSPAARLHIVDKEIAGNSIDDDGDGRIDETDNALVFTNRGSLGINTTDPGSTPLYVITPQYQRAMAIRAPFTGANTTTYISLENSTSDFATQGGVTLKARRTNAGTSGMTEFVVGVSSGTTAATNNEILTVEGTGNVGIGTIDPTSKLTVTGIIESTSGGFKFPDGTTQATAASGGGFTSGARAYQSTNQTFSQGVETIVQFQTESYDRLGEFSSNRFTAQASGYYLVSASVGIQSPGDQNRFDIAIVKNGGNYISVGVLSASGTEIMILPVTDVIQLSAGNYIEVHVWSITSTKNSQAQEGYTRFAVQRVY